MKKLLMMAVVVAYGVAVHAANIQWVGAAPTVSPAGDGTSWTDPNNWTIHGGGPAVPTTGDAVFIDDNISWAGNVPTLGVPLINSDVGSVDSVYQGFYAGQTSQLDVETGGVLLASSLFRTGHESGTSTTLDMTGGLIIAGALHNGYLGSGTINLSGDAIIHAGGFASGQEFALGGSGLITIADNAQFLVNGDDVGSGRAAGLIGAGWVAAANPGEWVVASYDAPNARTVYSVVPEPGTLSMLGLCGGAMLWIRRRTAS